MGLVSVILSILDKLPAALSATSRLVRAVKESEPPAPPPIAQQAAEYFRGYNDAVWKKHMDEHNAGSAERLAKALDEPIEEEKPDP